MLRALEKSLKKKKTDAAAAAAESWVLMAAHNEHYRGWILRCAVRFRTLHMLIALLMEPIWDTNFTGFCGDSPTCPDDCRWQLLWKQFSFNQMFMCHFWQTVGHALRSALGRHVPATRGKRAWVELRMWLRWFPSKLCPAFKYVHFLTIDHRCRNSWITTSDTW